MLPFENLNVYQEALRFTDNVYSLVSAWPKEEIFGLVDQIKRASVSVALNIAEGSSRTKKDFRHFLDQSRGSCYECVAILSIARKRTFITEKQFLSSYDHCIVIIRMINALRKSLL